MEQWVAGEDYPHFMNDESLNMLRGGYLLEGESPSDAIQRICDQVEVKIKSLCGKHNVKFDEIKEFENLSKRLQTTIWDNKFCPSSPMWSNLGTTRGFPISCYGTYIDDSIPSIAYSFAEIMNMSALGGGTSATLNPLRGKGSPINGKGKSKGVPHFEELYEEMIKRIDQGEIRKGAFVSFLDIEHDDFYYHMKIREKDSPIQRMTFGVTVKDSFIAKVWEKDPEALKRWALVLKSRSEKGLPYIFFIDNANKTKPKWYADLMIWHTNLCTEIMLPNSNEESFVCCVASMNAVTYDEWENDDSIFLGTIFMEAVMEDFIDKLENLISTDQMMVNMSRALKFAKRHRALGMGILGYHSYLQSKMIPFESGEANLINTRIFAKMKGESVRASKFLAELFGEAEVCEGFGVRHATNLAIAPTTSNASISGGWSPSSEVSMSNFYVVKLAKGKFIRKNVFLDEIFKERLSEEEYNDVWQEIMKNGGSVQHLSSVNKLTDNEKLVFKTFKETNQLEIVRQAANRQYYIDQAQSLNLNFPPDTPAKEINKIILEAHALGIKSLYYQRSETLLRDSSSIFDDMGCLTCEG